KNFSDAEHLTFIYSAGLFPGAAVRPIIHTFAGQPVIEVPKTPLDGWGAIYKRLFDIAVSLIFITLTLPIQILVGLAIILENPGPIFFRQKRVGQRAKFFGYFKFRSMFKDAHKFRYDPEFIKKYGNLREGTPLFKLENDPRITRVGRFIRKLHIDEVPEFYLVLFGRMSLVGPRPHMPGEVEQYKPSQRRVLNIKPGITGLAQISGQSNLEFDDEVQLDMHYIENWSPWLDLVILLKTPFVVLFERGTY
ncbi:MAG: sugar transferase, partial [Patescibacteria group bacterium]